MKENQPLKINVALVGNPNVGKSSLFNELTGLHQKVGNFSGVTVEKKEGKTSLGAKRTAKIIDLPGIYNLAADSEDEQITTAYLENGNTELIIVVADATNLRRNLLLCSQVMELGKPVILAINMMDLAERNKTSINVKSLSKLLNIPVVPINARIGKGIDLLKKAITDIDYPTLNGTHINLQKHTAEDTLARYQKIDEIISKTINDKEELPRSAVISNKIDNILIHPIYGYVIFLAILFIIFQAIFSWSTYPMELIENAFMVLSEATQRYLPEGNSR